MDAKTKNTDFGLFRHKNIDDASKTNSIFSTRGFLHGLLIFCICLATQTQIIHNHRP